MNTRKVATEYRLAQWAHLVQERQNRGQNIREFCETEGFSRNTYFYWQRRLREAACEHLAEQQMQAKMLVPSFAEVKMAEAPAPSSGLEEAGQIRAELAGINITADSAYPAEKLAALLRELVKSC